MRPAPKIGGINEVRPSPIFNFLGGHFVVFVPGAKNPSYGTAVNVIVGSAGA